MAVFISLGWMFTEVSFLQLVDADKLFPDDWEELEEFENNSTAIILEKFIPDREPGKMESVMILAVCLPILLIGLRRFKQSRYRSPQ